jgi:hypothetical protein
MRSNTTAVANESSPARATAFSKKALTRLISSGFGSVSDLKMMVA